MVSISPQYLPPEIDNKNNKRKKILLVVFLLLILIVLYFLIKSFLSNETPNNQEPIFSTYTICDFNPQEQHEKLTTRDTLETITFQDYLFYGENLNVFKEKYIQGEKDELVGKTIQFRDICTDTIHSFLINEDIDSNVPLQNLPVGFYQVSIQHNLDSYKLVHPEKINEHFTTITRSNKRNDVHLIADKNLFTDIYTQEPILLDNEFFVEIKETNVQNDVIDIVIDPAYNSQDFGPIDKGPQFEGFSGEAETYRFANDLRSNLEKYGLSVSITRKTPEIIMNTYGDKGRVFEAINSNAKLMVELYFESVEDRNLSGTSIYGSQFASINFQQQIIKQFDELNLPIFVGSRNQYGAFYNLLTEGLDSNNLIRESGGYALGAGKFSDISERLNPFAIDNKFGVHTISMNILMSSNWDFIEVYNQNYNQMVEATTKGILSFLGINP